MVSKQKTEGCDCKWVVEYSIFLIPRTKIYYTPTFSNQAQNCVEAQFKKDLSHLPPRKNFTIKAVM